MAGGDTIAAIATPPGQGGVAVVRISGPDSIAIADRVVRCSGQPPSKRETPALLHGFLVDQGADIDEVMVLLMRAPKSYTREDIVEIQCHGGSVVSRQILRTVLDRGARSATPGEFTARAFLNGRLDLVQAEAVADLISAQSERAASVALDQLKGGLSREISAIYEELISVVAVVEASLDFSEEDAPMVTDSFCIEEMRRISYSIDRLIYTYGEGRLLRDGARVVISGATNAGKSTLLNKLLASDRAIVSEIAGTTRDSIEEHIVLDGFPVTLIDTAGLRKTDCEIEGAGIKRSMEIISRADLHIYMVDSNIGVTAGDLEHIAKYDSNRFILVMNKIDLVAKFSCPEFVDLTVVPTSMTDSRGIHELRSAIIAKLESDVALASGPHAAISERHYHILTVALKEVQAAMRVFESSSDGRHVLAASHIREASESIGQLLGRTYHEDLLESVFSKFCIGK